MSPKVHHKKREPNSLFLLLKNGENKLKIGLIGLGTVGTGVVKTLKSFSGIEILGVSVNNPGKKRSVDLPVDLLTTDSFALVNNPEIDVIVEVAGGVEGIIDVLKQAIKNGKHVVTANKELLAKHGRELFELAEENNVVILYEAAVGGGIPIIMPMKMSLRANKINEIAAILNGTTNYILTKMTEEGCEYEPVLKEAQALGYAETNPIGDVEGFDAAYKIALLASIAFNTRIDINQIYKEGITQITAKDIKNAYNLGYRIKLIALAKSLSDGGIDVRVHPMLVPIESTLAQINNVTNAVMLKGFPIGEVVFTGPGAGEFPTSSAVVGDILALKADLKMTDKPLPLMRCEHISDYCSHAELIPIEETENKYYISLNVANEPGVIGLIGTVCGECGINLSSLLQKDVHSDDLAEVIVVTGVTKEKSVRIALTKLKEQSSINVINSVIRVMD